MAAILAGMTLVLGLVACDGDCEKYDYNACTIDRCVNGAATHEAMPNGAECLVGGKKGVCAGGTCAAACSSLADCNDHDECTADKCQGGVCVNLGGWGVPAPSGTCLQGACFQGAPKQIPKLDGTPCGSAGGECDHGVCSKCTKDSDCGQKLACEQWFCDQGKCKPDIAPAGSMLCNTIPYDCKRHMCDGQGNLKMFAAEDDLPAANYESCMQQTCEGWTAVFGPKPAGAQCKTHDQTWGVCDGDGLCVACVKDTDCPDWDDYCFAGMCNRCNDGKQNGNETGVDCGNGVCGACLGTPCDKNKPDLCSSQNCQDGVCCDSATCGVCKTCSSQSNLGKCIDMAVDQQDPVDCAATGKACDGNGACKTKNGFPCTISSECISNKCTLVNSVKLCMP